MQVEIKSPTEIHLIPETSLEDTVCRAHEWQVKVSQPKPLELNRGTLIITPIPAPDLSVPSVSSAVKSCL
jgi:hypothetical protein